MKNTTTYPMVQALTNYELLFKSWHQLNTSKSMVQEELENKGLSGEEITSILENYARYRLDRRNTLGWSLMGLGGFLGLVSCVLTILDPMPGLRGVFMYGVTSLAVTIALYGCYLVMEKPNDEEE